MPINITLVIFCLLYPGRRKPYLINRLNIGKEGLAGKYFNKN